MSFKQSDLKIHGHAVEARVYAEDASNGFLPTIGTIPYHRVPSGPGIRTDAGVERGSEISVHYDPLLTKIATWAPDRISAIRKMDYALSTYIISGLITNIPLLKWVLIQEKFLEGNYSIDFIDEEFVSKNPAALLESFGEKHSEVAGLFAVLFKMNKSAAPAPGDGRTSENQWTSSRY